MSQPVAVVDQAGGARERRRPPSARLPLPLVVGVLVAVLLGALVVATRARPEPAQPGVLPVLGPARDVYDGDLGDPFVLPVTSGGNVVRFVAFGTGDWPARVPTARSVDLTTWEEGPDALPQLPAWTAPDPKNSLSWAPAALQVDRGYVLYVTLPDAASGQQCIGAAASAQPEGPYSGVGDGPLICQHDLGGSIDPALVRDRDGALHMLWKNDGNSFGVPSSLWEQELTRDGLGVVGPAHRLLTASRPWQGDIVEEPAMIAATGGGWWLSGPGAVGLEVRSHAVRARNPPACGSVVHTEGSWRGR